MIYTTETIKKKNARKIAFKKLLEAINIIIIISISIFATYIGYMKYIKHEQDISILGFRHYVVATNSMEPKYNIGDLIIIKQIPINKIKVGDVINYISENQTDTITHRVVQITEIDGQKYYKTKGDSNNSEDSELINQSRIRGILLFKVSKVGIILTKMLTGTGLVVLFGIILLSYFRDKDKEEKKLARENARKLYNNPKYGEKDI